MRKVAILGAGISGLTLAWELKKREGKSVDLHLFEKEKHVGGWIRTFKEGALQFEGGPKGLRPTPFLLQFIEELGLTDQLVVSSPLAKKRYLLYKEKLHLLPTSAFKFFASPLTRPLLLPFLFEWSKRPATFEESLYDFFKRRLGLHAAEVLGRAMAYGIYAADPKDLSVASAFPSLAAMEAAGSLTAALLKKRKSVKSTLPPLITFKQGMEQLPKALFEQINAHWHLGTQVEGLDLSQEKPALIVNGEQQVFDQIYSALPAHALALLLPSSPERHLLQTIRSTSLTVVSLAFKNQINPYPGFGFLSTSKDFDPLLGMTFDSDTFIQHNQDKTLRLSAMVRTYDPTFATEVAKKSVKKHLRVQVEPFYIKARTAPHCIAYYEIGHKEKVRKIKVMLRQENPHFFVTGSSFDGVSVSDCIKVASQLVCRIQKE